jgi:hypothetical protein
MVGSVAGSRLRQDAQEPAAGFVDVNERATPTPALHIALNLVHVGRGGAAGLELGGNIHLGEAS